MSTDIAHSLADSFDLPLGSSATKILPNLWGQEVDIYQTLGEYWGTIRQYVSALLAWRGMNRIVADEVAILPGMEELANLLYIAKYDTEKTYDVVIVDSAPTGETLRLLSFPDIMEWWMNHLFPIQRRVAKVVRPVLRRVTDAPMPPDSVFDAVRDLYAELEHVHTLMSDMEQSSIRLVINPEKMVIKEAQRTLTYLNLFGYATDAVIVNRILPDRVEDEYFNTWKTNQKKYLEYIKEAFSPLQLLNVPLMEEEVVGVDMLRKMGQAVYGDADATGIFYHGHVQSVTKDGDDYILSLQLPFIKKEEIGLVQDGDELHIKVGQYRRSIVLPHMLSGLPAGEAKMIDKQLNIRFHGEEGTINVTKSGNRIRRKPAKI